MNSHRILISYGADFSSENNFDTNKTGYQSAQSSQNSVTDNHISPFFITFIILFVIAAIVISFYFFYIKKKEFNKIITSKSPTPEKFNNIENSDMSALEKYSQDIRLELSAPKTIEDSIRNFLRRIK